MKTIISTIAVVLFANAISAQDPANSYTNGASGTMPGSPDQPAQLYPGTNPSPNPNQRGGATITIPDPTGVRTGSNNTYYQAPTGATPAQTNPSGTRYPNSTVPTPTNQTQRLFGFQDPVKTSKYPNSDPPTGSRDGSSGKFKSSHKSSNGHNFAKHKRHIKKAKKSNGNSDKSRQDVR